MINLAYMLQDSPSPPHTLHIQPIHFFGTSDKERKDADNYNAYARRLKKQLKD